MYEVRIYTLQGGGGLLPVESFPTLVQAEAYAQNWVSTVGQYMPYQYSGFKYWVDIIEPYVPLDDEAWELVG